MTPIGPSDRDDIQGIILTGYGHLLHTSSALFSVRNPDRALIWLKGILPAITTARPWQKRSDGSTDKPSLTLNLAFTHAGLTALGLLEPALNTFPREFTEGMAEPKRAETLGDTGDSAPDLWEFGGRTTTPVHLLLLLHGDSPERLEAWLCQLLTGAEPGVSLITIEPGYRAPTFKEHFGFTDSISQPSISGFQSSAADGSDIVATGEVLLGYPNGYGLLPISPVVPESADPAALLPPFPGGELPGMKDFGHNGSFLVYRKLAQDVAGFWGYIIEQTHKAHGAPDPEAMKLMASKMVGRWPSGAPLTLAPERDDPGMVDKNNFTYLAEDADGHRCPIGAHIRRTHPRDSLQDAPGRLSIVTSSRHRILRRGSLYGEPLYRLEDIEAGSLPLEIKDDGQPRGLHFFCLNSDIGRQFEFVQQTWSNNPRFNGLYDDKDPIIGDNDGTGQMTIQGCPVRQRLPNLPRFVSMKGGAYFFLPSLKSLRLLVQNTDH